MKTRLERKFYVEDRTTHTRYSFFSGLKEAEEFIQANLKGHDAVAFRMVKVVDVNYVKRRY